ncbi:MAG TPA: four helix bundle protein [Ignavibacteria bacterium]|nr:four helix bundle protein [Ignavibacteria bacterium]
MKEIIVRDKAFDFAVRIIRLNIYLRDNKKEFVLSKQILKAGTSIGANIEEATGGISKADFKYKLSIAYKEGRETHYWLRLFHKTNFIEDKMFFSLEKDCTEILKILYTIIKNLK